MSGNGSYSGWVLINSPLQTFSGLTFTDFYIAGNNPKGAVFYVQNSSVTIQNCIIANNTCGIPGDVTAAGALCVQDGTMNVINTTFIGNSAGIAAAVYTGNQAKPVFTNCTFYGNQAGVGGWAGAIGPEDSSAPEFYNCWFEENSATYGGAVDDGIKVFV